MKLTSIRKKGDVHSAIGFRFDVAVADAARLATERALRHVFAEPSAWTVLPAIDRTYLRAVRFGAPFDRADGERHAAALGAHASIPPLVVLDVRPNEPQLLPRLRDALVAGDAPAGIVDVAAHADGFVVEIDAARAPLAPILARIDQALGRARSIDPLLPLEDDVLAAFAAARLGEPHLDASRILETYV